MKSEKLCFAVASLALAISCSVSAEPAAAAKNEIRDCAALKNSAKREPEWYAQECLGKAYGSDVKAQPLSEAAKTIGDTTYQFNMRGTGTGADSLQSFLLPNANTATIIGPQAGNLTGSSTIRLRRRSGRSTTPSGSANSTRRPVCSRARSRSPVFPPGRVRPD